MSITESALKNYEELWPDYKSKAMHTDPRTLNALRCLNEVVPE